MTGVSYSLFQNKEKMETLLNMLRKFIKNFSFQLINFINFLYVY